jgi:hypothetical protein
MSTFLVPSQSIIDGIINGIQLNQFSLSDIIVAMLASLLSGIAIVTVYRYSYQGTVYNHQFNLSLLLMNLITAMIILTISSNLILSLGMVGALSIVRFRSAIKDPVDIVYIFWAISAGLAVGANQLTLLLISTAVIGGAFYVSSKVILKKNTYIIVTKFPSAKEDAVQRSLGEFKYKVRSKYFEGGKLELTIEVQQKEHLVLASLNQMNLDFVSMMKFDS